MDVTQPQFDLDKATDEELRALQSEVLRQLIDRARTGTPPAHGIGPHDRHHSVYSRSTVPESITGNARNHTKVNARLAPFVPTPFDVVCRLLRLADVNERDIVYDLGCGDGRCVVSAAATHGARGVGVDIDQHCIRLAEAHAKAAGVERLTRFEVADATTVDVSTASVVVLYLLHWSTLELRARLTRCLQPGARIVSHGRGMGDWPPEKVDTFVNEDGATVTLYLWIADGKERP